MNLILRMIGHLSTDADAVSFLDAHLSREFFKNQSIEVDEFDQVRR